MAKLYHGKKLKLLFSWNCTDSEESKKENEIKEMFVLSIQHMKTLCLCFVFKGLKIINMPLGKSDSQYKL